MDSLGLSIDELNTMLGILGIFVFGYLLLMGFARRAGKSTWLEREVQRRRSTGKPNATLSSKSNKTEFPWNDASLIEGGFTALIHVALLTLYVPITLLIGYYILGYQYTVIRNTGSLLPVVMVYVGFLVFIRLGSYTRQYALPKEQFRVLKVAVVASGVLGLAIAVLRRLDLITSDLLLISVELGLLLVVSYILSYVYGISDGLKDANIETRFPLVEVRTNQGNILKGLRLYEKTDSDYRFISENGVDHIIPSAVIMEIRHASKAENSTTPGTSKPEKPSKKSR